MSPTITACAEEALGALHAAAAAGSPFGLILSDLHMPEMNGFALAEEVSRLPDLAVADIILLSSAGQRGDGARCRELGVAGYLNKPVRQSELRAAILTVLRARQGGARPESSVTRHSLREHHAQGQRILVAEDNAVNQLVIRGLIEKNGHTAHIVNNGIQVLKAIEEQDFDLVLMDVQMPEMDGYEATAEIRRRELVSGKHHRIIAMTAHAMTGDKEKCLAAGMDGYLAKPVGLSQLMAVLDQSSLVSHES
jgi:CheY-like chemotaxis protein